MPELSLLESGNRFRFNSRGIRSIDRFYEFKGFGASQSDLQVIVAAQLQGFPDIGDTEDGFGGLGPDYPCYDYGLVTLMGPEAGADTYGAILFAKFGFPGGGGGIATSQGAAIGTRDESFRQPYFFKDSAGYYRRDFDLKRIRTTIVFQGIVGNQYTAENVQGEITEFSGYAKLLTFDKLGIGSVSKFFLFTGAKLLDKSGSSLTYSAVFTTTSPVLGILGNQYDHDGDVDIPALNNLEDYVIDSGRGGQAPTVVVRPVLDQYPEVPQGALGWVTQI